MLRAKRAQVEGDGRAATEWLVFFRLAYILRQLGFNALQIEKGVYHNAPERRPFTIEAIPECFAKAKALDFLANQKLVLKKLAAYCPAQFLEGQWVIDRVNVSVLLFCCDPILPLLMTRV